MSNIVKAGILGLDSMLYGGIPEGNQVLLAGGPGSGKTLLALEYLYRNALERHPGVFLALDEDSKSILNNVKSTFPKFSELDSLMSSKMLTLESIDLTKKEQKGTYEFSDVLQKITELVSAQKATRVAIDSISMLSILTNDQIGYRKSMLSLSYALKDMGVTSLLLVDANSPEKNALEYAPEYYIFDGIICMYQSSDQEKRLHTMKVLKMRGSKHSFITTPYEITEEGFKVFSAEDTMVF